MRTLLIALSLTLLAACGIDGAPVTPDKAATGVTVSGEARIGVTGTL